MNGHVGFTGTARGMTDAQKSELRRGLHDLWQMGFAYFHHGDCIGADAEAHTIALSLGYKVVLHPPSDPKARAFCQVYHLCHPEESYLTRNQDIVGEADILIAAPAGDSELRRSGTWATIRYGRAAHKTVTIITPAGRVL